jgi:hypothetical protein
MGWGKVDMERCLGIILNDGSGNKLLGLLNDASVKIFRDNCKSWIWKDIQLRTLKCDPSIFLWRNCRKG